MRKEYGDAIIGAIGGGVGGTIIWYILRGEIPWGYLITYPIFSAIAHLIGYSLRKRREAKKEDEPAEGVI